MTVADEAHVRGVGSIPAPRRAAPAETTLDLDLPWEEAEPTNDHPILIGLLGVGVLVGDAAYLLSRWEAVNVRPVMRVVHTILDGQPPLF